MMDDEWLRWVGGGIVAWFATWSGIIHARVSKANDRIDHADEKLSAHMLDTAKQYVTRSELGESLRDIKVELKRIFDKLDGKADK